MSTHLIHVVGRTSPREVFLISRDRPFMMDEYMVIQDERQGNAVGEVVETQAYPKIAEDTFLSETGIYQSLEELGMIQNDTALYVARVKLLDELQMPVAPYSKVRTPDFSDIEELLIHKQPEQGFTLGVIRGTDALQTFLPDHLKNISPLYDREKGVSSQEGIPFILDFYALREYPHIGLFGGSGSGKTFGLRVICEEIMKKGIPAIVFDPHFELSFQQNMEGLPKEAIEHFGSKHEIFQIGENVGINFTELNTEELTSLIEHVADLTQPMRGALDQLHERNDSFTTLTNRIHKLMEAFEFYEQPEHKRKGDLSDDVVLLYEKHRTKVAGLPTLQALSWRLDQLNKTGIFNSDVSQVEACLLKRKVAVVRGKQSHLKMIASYMIGKLYYKRRTYKDWEQANLNQRIDQYTPPKFPPFFVIMDESHVFAPDGERANPTKRILREIAQEARKYGVFEVFGTQRPALLDKTIVAQLNTKIIFRTSIESDMKMIQTETNLTEEQMLRLPDLTSGNAFVSSATLRKTFYIRFRVTKTVSPHSGHPFDELDDYGMDEKIKKVLLDYLPLKNDKIHVIHSEITKALGRFISRDEIEQTLDALAEQGEIQKEESFMGKKYFLQ